MKWEEDDGIKNITYIANKYDLKFKVTESDVKTAMQEARKLTAKERPQQKMVFTSTTASPLLKKALRNHHFSSLQQRQQGELEHNSRPPMARDYMASTSFPSVFKVAPKRYHTVSDQLSYGESSAKRQRHDEHSRGLNDGQLVFDPASNLPHAEDLGKANSSHSPSPFASAGEISQQHYGSSSHSSAIGESLYQEQQPLNLSLKSS